MVHHTRSFPSITTNLVLGFENLFGIVLSYDRPLPHPSASLKPILEVVSYKIYQPKSIASSSHALNHV